MNGTGRNFLFFGALALSVLVGASELWWLRRLQASARRETANLADKRAQCERLVREDPAPGAANERAIEAALVGAEEALARLRADWTEVGAPAPPSPARPVDAFFEIASFVEQMRALAGRQQVAIKTDEHFGFATYANGGPEAALLPIVSRQRQLIQQMLEALLAARPRELLAVQRERPLAGVPLSARRTPAAAGAKPGEVETDFFVPDRRLAAKAPGSVDTLIFRFVFSGQTPTLRTLLNSFAGFAMPVVVRRVEVERLPSEPLKTSATPAAADPSVALIPPSFSKFTVVAEFTNPVDFEKAFRP